MTSLTIRIIARNVSIEEAMLQHIEISIASSEPSLNAFPVENPEKIVDAAIKIQRAIAGVKSNAEKRRNENLLNLLR